MQKDSPINAWRQSLNRYQLLGKVGKVVSFTQGDGCFAMVEFEDGQKIVGQIVSETKTEKLDIGVKVVGVLRRLRSPDREGIVEYTVKFKTL
jgi:uncharacterized OB-fold protein